MMQKSLLLFVILILAVTGLSPTIAQDTVENLVPEVLGTRPHDPDSWIQGLILHDGFLYESAGQYGQSSLRQVDPETGEVLLYLPLPEQVFAEGLALVDDYFYQLTWREQVAFHLNLSAFTEGAELDVAIVEYEGEGWGLCYDGDMLYMSDGSDILTLRDPETFDVVDTLQVTYEEIPLGQMVYDGEAVTAPVLVSTPAPLPAVGERRRPAERIGMCGRFDLRQCVADRLYLPHRQDNWGDHRTD